MNAPYLPLGLQRLSVRFEMDEVSLPCSIACFPCCQTSFGFPLCLQEKLLTLPVSFFDNNKSGALVSRVMTDVEGVRNLVGTGLVQLIGGSITAVISLVILIKINAQMTLFVLVPVAIFALIALKAFGYIRPIFRTRGKINATVTGRLTETLNGIRVIKGFNAEEQEQRVFEKGVYDLFQNVKKSLTATEPVDNN